MGFCPKCGELVLWPPTHTCKDPVVTSLIEGQEVRVRAWWTRPVGQLLPCRIINIYKASPHATVEPLQGNTHHRQVKLSDIVGSEYWETDTKENT
jgi:hypothetical protein